MKLMENVLVINGDWFRTIGVVEHFIEDKIQMKKKSIVIINWHRPYRNSYADTISECSIFQQIK